MSSNSKTAKTYSTGGASGPVGKRRLQNAALLLIGPFIFMLVMLVPETSSFTAPMKGVAATTCWMAFWWLTDAAPIPVTSLLPLALFPLTGALSFGETAPSYADSNVFLFMGGFMIAAAIEKCNLHRRIALHIIRIVGTRPQMLILGFMIATGFISMWISNTATAMMMLPIGTSVILQMGSLQNEKDKKGIMKSGFGQALMLSIAYSATIGGVATLIGTPPNAIIASAAQTMYGLEISFAKWMVFGVPLAILFMAICWLYLTRSFDVSRLKPAINSKEYVLEEIKKLGALSRSEIIVLCVFSIVSLSWISRGFLLSRWFPQLNDAIIAIIGALILFIVPVDLGKKQFVLDWDSAVRIPWGILLLFGGGISIATGFGNSGLAGWLGDRLGVFTDAPFIVILAILLVAVKFLTEITSNTGTAAIMMPVAAAMATATAVHPLGLMVAAGAAAALSFMLPVGTPPNAIIFSSGNVTISTMARKGFILNLLAILLLLLLVYFWLPLAFGIDLFSFNPCFPAEQQICQFLSSGGMVF